MTDSVNDTPLEDTRLFCVPINEYFAKDCAEVLNVYRRIAESALDVPDEGLNTESVFCREVDVLHALPDSPLKEARGQLHSLSVDGGWLIWAHAIDHVRALEHDILMKPPPVWSPLALARVTLEGCAFNAYLYDPSITLTQRLARSASMRMAEAQNGIHASKGFGRQEKDYAEGQKAEAEQLLSDAGAVPKLSRRGDKLVGYTLDGEEAPLNHTISSQIASFLPEWAAGSYPLLSGAAHGRPWMIARSRSKTGLAGEAATVMAAVMVVMGAMESGIAVWGGFFGVDVTEPLSQMHSAREEFIPRSQVLAHAFQILAQGPQILKALNDE
ncbi:hypothetical protein ACIO1C_27445 [Streptomyces sp. NPDC087420]|uniref:hypothetical protein n=1 Tax=Streptomyces sp. NPDC087420 TaxID=3365785 RepID=UPI003836A86A